MRAARSPRCRCDSIPANQGSHRPHARRAAPSHTRTTLAMTRTGRRSRLVRATTDRVLCRASRRLSRGEDSCLGCSSSRGYRFNICRRNARRCQIAGRVHRGYDICAQPATAPRRAVCAWSVWLHRGAAKRGRAVETGRMSQVHTTILETAPSQWLSESLTTDGIRIYTLMPCMLQVLDGACWTQSTPTNMGWSGRGDDPSWVVRGVGRLEMRSRRQARVRGWQAVVNLKMGVVVRTCTTTPRLASAPVQIIGSIMKK